MNTDCEKSRYKPMSDTHTQSQCIFLKPDDETWSENDLKIQWHGKEH